MSTTGVPGCRAFTARSRSRPDRPGILMSETTRSKASAAITLSSCSAATAWLTTQPLAENAETRNRSSDALSSTTRTRSVSGAAVTSAGEAIIAPYLVVDIWFRKSIHWRVSTPSLGNVSPSNSCGSADMICLAVSATIACSAGEAGDAGAAIAASDSTVSAGAAGAVTTGSATMGAAASGAFTMGSATGATSVRTGGVTISAGASARTSGLLPPSSAWARSLKDTRSPTGSTTGLATGSRLGRGATSLRLRGVTRSTRPPSDGILVATGLASGGSGAVVGAGAADAIVRVVVVTIGRAATGAIS